MTRDDASCAGCSKGGRRGRLCMMPMRGGWVWTPEMYLADTPALFPADVRMKGTIMRILPRRPCFGLGVMFA